MNIHLQQRVKDLFAIPNHATLATCGLAGPQISIVSIQASGLQLVLFVPTPSDHLFNLESQPELALLTTVWKLHGRGIIPQDERTRPLHNWQTAIRVQPLRLHVLSKDGKTPIETIDF